MTLAGILIIAGFFVFAALMASRILPPVLALPLMAAWVCRAVKMPLHEYLNEVLYLGSMKLSSAIAVVVFGAMFAKIVMKTGISASLIKQAAELAGDRPRFIAFVLLFSVIFVFLGMGGLGAVIMAGSVALPIMTGAGIAPVDAAAVFILGINAGLMANLANYGTYIGIFGGEVVTDCYPPALLISIIAAVLYVFLNIKQTGGTSSVFAFVRLFFGALLLVPKSFVLAIAKIFQKRETTLYDKDEKIPACAVISPLIPLVTVYGFKYTYGFDVKAGGIDPVAAAVCGFLLAGAYAVLTTKPREALNIFAGAIVEGICDVAGVIFLFFGIGMLVAAVMQPQVTAVLNPLLKEIVPSSHIQLALFFALLAPAALYRGPLNMFGMGAGIAVLLASLNIANGAFLCGMFLAVQFLQGVSDPTNSSNTWIGDFVKVDASVLLKKTLPYSWGMCLAMLAVVLIKGGGA